MTAICTLFLGGSEQRGLSQEIASGIHPSVEYLRLVADHDVELISELVGVDADQRRLHDIDRGKNILC